MRTKLSTVHGLLRSPASTQILSPSFGALSSSSPEGPTQTVKTTMSATSVGVIRCWPLFPLPVAFLPSETLRQLARHWLCRQTDRQTQRQIQRQTQRHADKKKRRQRNRDWGRKTARKNWEGKEVHCTGSVDDATAAAPGSDRCYRLITNKL